MSRDRANCMSEGSWETLWRWWWRSHVVTLFHSVNTTAFHLCRLWFSWFQHIVFELLTLITAASPDSPKIHAIFKIGAETLKNCPQATMNQPRFLVIKVKTWSWFFSCKKCQIEATSVRRPFCSFRPHYRTADWPQSQTLSHSDEGVGRDVQHLTNISTNAAHNSLHTLLSWTGIFNRPQLSPTSVLICGHI